MAGVRAGDLNRLVSVQQRSTTQDAIGGQTHTWTEIKQVYAAIEVAGVRAMMAAQALQTAITHTIEVRYDADLFADPRAAAKLRIVYGSRNFDVQGMENVQERNRRVVLTCIEGLSEG